MDPPRTRLGRTEGFVVRGLVHGMEPGARRGEARKRVCARDRARPEAEAQLPRITLLRYAA